MVTNGPNGDGSKSLTRESWIGQFVHGAAVVLALSIASGIGSIDFTPLPDYLEPIGVGAASTLVGLITAWASRNRRPLPASGRVTRS